MPVRSTVYLYQRGFSNSLASSTQLSADWWSNSSDDIDIGLTQKPLTASTIKAAAGINSPTGDGEVPLAQVPSGRGAADQEPQEGEAASPSSEASEDQLREQFVNHAFNLWTERRQQWVGKPSRRRSSQRDPVLSPDASYEDLLLDNRAFPRPVPLPEMVDFLIGAWELEGLYD
eukprot:TRINITY_DN4439_c0_g1_i3.p1 TRINITY_DN4439_c0_g1~~TRINITY_DN4439_c0_g1_i3.p1  ORF type:complete len:174 (+),score=35.78 TRINITY_DN4439_c0_g1_i3:298-819(+)